MKFSACEAVEITCQWPDLSWPVPSSVANVVIVGQVDGRHREGWETAGGSELKVGSIPTPYDEVIAGEVTYV